MYGLIFELLSVFIVCLIVCCWVYSVYMYVFLCLGWDGVIEGGWIDRLLVGLVLAIYGS